MTNILTDLCNYSFFLLRILKPPYNHEMFKFIFLMLFTTALRAAPAIISSDLSQLDEDKYLGKGKAARLLAIESYDKDKEPLILVHGIRGNPVDLQKVVDRFKDSNFQLMVLAYADFKKRTSVNGTMFAEELRRLDAPKLTIVAHSMGGLVSRKALADLSESGDNKDVTFFSVDTPWHGFDGPSDDNFRYRIAELFIPAGLEDMRSRSDFFKDINSSRLSTSIKVHLSFAEEGTEAFGPTETDQFIIPEMKENFEKALALTQEEILIFPGNHMTVIGGKFLDYLENKLKETRAP